jgi:hypothetical protein
MRGRGGRHRGGIDASDEILHRSRETHPVKLGYLSRGLCIRIVNADEFLSRDLRENSRMQPSDVAGSNNADSKRHIRED